MTTRETDTAGIPRTFRKPVFTLRDSSSATFRMAVMRVATFGALCWDEFFTGPGHGQNGRLPYTFLGI